MKNIRKFSSIAEYNNAEIAFPNVSLNTASGNNVKYMKSWEDPSYINTYKNQYFTIECVKSGKIQFGPGHGDEFYTPRHNSDTEEYVDPYQLFLNGTLYIKYSRNNGASWTNITNQNNNGFWKISTGDVYDSYTTYVQDGPLKIEFNMHTGDKILISANLRISENCQLTYHQESDPELCVFDTYCEDYAEDENYDQIYDEDQYGTFKVYGNLRSLFLGDNFLSSYNNNFILGEYAWDWRTDSQKFHYTSVGPFFLGKSIVDAENLICDFPAIYENFIYGIDAPSIIEKGPTFVVNSDPRLFRLNSCIFSAANKIPKLESFKLIGNINSWALFDIFNFLESNGVPSNYWSSYDHDPMTLYISSTASCQSTVDINGQTVRTIPTWCTLQTLS